MNSFQSSSLKGFSASALHARGSGVPVICSEFQSVAVDTDYYDASRSVTLTFHDTEDYDITAWEGQKITLAATLTLGSNSVTKSSSVTIGTLTHAGGSVYTYTFSYDTSAVATQFITTHGASDSLVAVAYGSSAIKSLANSEGYRQMSMNLQATVQGVDDCSRSLSSPTTQHIVGTLYFDSGNKALSQGVIARIYEKEATSEDDRDMWTKHNAPLIIETPPTKYWLRTVGTANPGSSNWENMGSSGFDYYVSLNPGAGADAPTTHSSDDWTPSGAAEEKVYGSYPAYGPDYRVIFFHEAIRSWFAKTENLSTSVFTGYTYGSATALRDSLVSTAQSYVATRGARLSCGTGKYYYVWHVSGYSLNTLCYNDSYRPHGGAPVYQGLW